MRRIISIPSATISLRFQKTSKTWKSVTYFEFCTASKTPAFLLRILRVPFMFERFERKSHSLYVVLFPFSRRCFRLRQKGVFFWESLFYPPFAHVLHSYLLVVHTFVHKIVHIVWCFSPNSFTSEGHNVCLSVEIPRIWVPFGIVDFTGLCTISQRFSTVIHRFLHRFSTLPPVSEKKTAHRKQTQPALTSVNGFKTRVLFRMGDFAQFSTR